MSREDGGPDFTCDDGSLSGMTLRDYFAAKAMQALLQAFPYTGAMDMAKSAYEQADAMLAARKEATR